MDEYHCSAYPKNINMLFCSDCVMGQFFHVEFKYTNMYVLSATKFSTNNDTTYHTFPNVSASTMMQETTIVSWLSSMGVPKEAYKTVVASVLGCAHDMAHRTHKHQRVLFIRVDLVITWGCEDASDGEDNDDDDDVEEEDDDDDGLVPADKASIEGLEIVRDEGRCAICFEDFNVGVRMPCFHMFHTDCITDWLHIANSCPLCRFQMPTNTSE